jgi:hypothetical protein
MGGLLYKRQNIENRPEDEIYQNIIPFNEKIPKDEFLCPNCHQLVPEVLSLHLDIKKIDFKCKICNKIYKNSQSYQSELLKNNYLFTKCHYCDKSSQNNEDIFSYCYDCKFDFCDQCKPNHDKENIAAVDGVLDGARLVGSEWCGRVAPACAVCGKKRDHCCRG